MRLNWHGAKSHTVLLENRLRCLTSQRIPTQVAESREAKRLADSAIALPRRATKATQTLKKTTIVKSCASNCKSKRKKGSSEKCKRPTHAGNGNTAKKSAG